MWEAFPQGSGTKLNIVRKNEKKLVFRSIIVGCFIAFIVNLDVEETGVAKGVKIGKKCLNPEAKERPEAEVQSSQTIRRRADGKTDPERTS